MTKYLITVVGSSVAPQENYVITAPHTAPAAEDSVTLRVTGHNTAAAASISVVVGEYKLIISYMGLILIHIKMKTLYGVSLYR